VNFFDHFALSCWTAATSLLGYLAMKPGKDTPSSKIRLRKHLNTDALVRAVRREFEKIPDPRKGRPQISFADAAMSAFAMFSMRDPSLPALEKRWSARDHNLHALHHIEKVPADSTIP